MTGCAMLSADHDKRYGLRTLRAREHRSKRVHASSSILRAPSHVSSSVVARCLLALFMFDVSALARIHERCTHDSVRRLREVVSFPLWFAPSPSKPAGKRTNNVARAMGYPVRGERGREATRIAGRLASAANRTAPVSIASAARAAWGVPVHRERLPQRQNVVEFRTGRARA